MNMNVFRPLSFLNKIIAAIRSVGLAVLALGLMPSMAAGQIMFGQVDDFQDGTAAAWQQGGSSPNPPFNVSNGGPNGIGDAYLRTISTGGGGPGSKMIMFNTAQWSGDYVSAGVTRITAQLANFG